MLYQNIISEFYIKKYIKILYQNCTSTIGGSSMCTSVLVHVLWMLWCIAVFCDSL